jgi:predicted ArsR family transcriptional regulator
VSDGANGYCDDVTNRPAGQPTTAGDDDVAALAALQDPLRLALYEYVLGETDPVSRDQAAQAIGISRESAAFHLDRLASEGLLDIAFRRLSGKQGPGAGRPAKLYSRSAREIQVSLPPRRYDVAARLFAGALASPSPAAALTELARTFGESLGARALPPNTRTSAKRRLESAVNILDSYGYQPSITAEQIALRNCPFDALAKEHRDVVCTMNTALIGGLVSGLNASDMTTVYRQQEGRCCVTINRQKESPPESPLS